MRGWKIFWKANCGRHEMQQTEVLRSIAQLCLSVLLAITLAGSASAQHSKDQKLTKAQPEHYLLLVNTAIASMMDEGKFRQFDKSPYDGLAVAFQHAYDTSEVPLVAAMDIEITEWKKYTKKDIWPWLYLNRMIGWNAGEDNPHSDTPYFRRIAGADLDDENGARSAFLKMWRNSIAAARHAKSPGIVCDLEFYNHYKEYDIGELARQTGKKPAEVAGSLQNLGAKMASVAAEEYPDAILWLLFTGLTHPGYKKLEGVEYYPSPTYVAIGLLDEISRKHLRLKVFAGGEGSLAYCHESVSEFQSAIMKREEDMEGALSKYKGALEMAGTMTLWSEAKAKKGWVNEGSCKAASAQTVEELQPYLELLLKSYRYNWIYGSPDGNYLAFVPESAPRFDAVISKAKANAFPGQLP